jgi:hypothetical protein
MHLRTKAKSQAGSELLIPLKYTIAVFISAITAHEIKQLFLLLIERPRIIFGFF